LREYTVVERKKRALGQSALTGKQLYEHLNHMARDGWIYQNAIRSESRWFGASSVLLVFYREKG